MDLDRDSDSRRYDQLASFAYDADTERRMLALMRVYRVSRSEIIRAALHRSLPAFEHGGRTGIAWRDLGA